MSQQTGSASAPSSGHLSLGIWLAAAAELAVALVVGVILLHYGRAPQQHGMDSMPDMPMHHPQPQIRWTFEALAASTIAIGAGVGWSLTRARSLAGVTAVGLIVVVASGPIRTLALHSHVVAMVALETTLTAAPLLALTAVRVQRPSGRCSAINSWSVGAMIAAAAYGAFLIVLHLPGIHDRATDLIAVPLWVVGLAVIIGFTYWSLVLLTAGLISPAIRRTALIIGQEIAAILGLAALFSPSPFMQHQNPFELSSAQDQRLGGALMLLVCAVVTLPMLTRLAGHATVQRQPGSADR